MGAASIPLAALGVLRSLAPLGLLVPAGAIGPIKVSASAPDILDMEKPTPLRRPSRSLVYAFLALLP
jgi:hypothetical protein